MSKTTKETDTGIAALTKLAQHEDEEVRAEVAFTTEDLNLLTLLSQDKHWDVRGAVAENESTPPALLSKLVADEHLYVRMAVTHHPSTPPEALTIVAKDEKWEVRFAVAYNENTPASVLGELSHDENDTVRRTALKNLESRL